MATVKLGPPRKGWTSGGIDIKDFRAQHDDQVIRMYNEVGENGTPKYTVSQIAEHFGIKHSTLRAILRAIRKEQAEEG